MNPEMYTVAELQQIITDSERWGGKGDISIKDTGIGGALTGKTTRHSLDTGEQIRNSILDAAKEALASRQEQEQAAGTQEPTREEKRATFLQRASDNARAGFMNPDMYTTKELQQIIDGSERWGGKGPVDVKDTGIGGGLSGKITSYTIEGGEEIRGVVLDAAKEALSTRLEQEQQQAADQEQGGGTTAGVDNNILKCVKTALDAEKNREPCQYRATLDNISRHPNQQVQEEKFRAMDVTRDAG